MKERSFLFSPVLLFAALLLACDAFAQPTIQWQKSLGGSGDDRANSIQHTTDGGYIVAGYSTSQDGDVSSNHGSSDLWVVKLGATGGIQWQKALGGSKADNGNSILQTADGGYIVAGLSLSNDGDVSGNHGDKDCWIVKLNTAGDIQWQNTLGGTGLEEATSIQQTLDGGYIVAGVASSNNGDVSGNHGSLDCWVVKLNATGDIQWQKSLGGSGLEQAGSIQQTSDGGYIMAGYSYSNNGNVSGNHGGGDYWIVKLDAVGDIQWKKALGGTQFERAFSIQPTTDGGYIVAGASGSNDGNVIGHHGGPSPDCWIVKLNTDGDIQWQKSLGGTKSDQAYSIQQTPDGGYVLAGFASSNDGDVSGNHGNEDFWVAKLNAFGDIQWQKSLGGSSLEEAYSIQLTLDGGYIVAGASYSNDGDISGSHGDADYWIVKLSPVSSTLNLSTAPEALTLSPNPTTALLTVRLSDPYAMDAYTLSDLAGRTLRTAHFGQPVQETTLNTADLPKGMYLLQVYSGGQVFVQKVVVQ